MVEAIGPERLARLRALAETRGQSLQDVLGEAVSDMLRREASSDLHQELEESISRYRTLYERLAQ